MNTPDSHSPPPFWIQYIYGPLILEIILQHITDRGSQVEGVFDAPMTTTDFGSKKVSMKHSLWILFMKLQFRKQSTAELVSWTIPQSGGYNTTQLATETFPKARFGVHTRDLNILKIQIFQFLSRKKNYYSGQRIAPYRLTWQSSSVVSYKYLYKMSFRSEAYSPAMLGRNLNDRQNIQDISRWSIWQGFIETLPENIKEGSIQRNKTAFFVSWGNK